MIQDALRWQTRAAKSFQYDTLWPDQRQARKIRVLEVDRQLSPDGLIQCRLTTVGLSNTHIALSYTWSHVIPTYWILVNGCAFSVRHNLYQFLSVARLQLHSRPLWIDAICINQNSLSERNEQVSFMPDIYRQANETFIWLEQADDARKDFFEMLVRLGALKALAYAEDKSSATSEAEMSDATATPPAAPLTLVESTLLAPYLAKLIHICNLPYWERLWVVQEFRLSQRRVLVYGQSQITSEQFQRLFHAAFRAPSSCAYARNLSQSKAALFYESFGAAAGLASTDKAAFLDLYLDHTERKCVDFHDRCYALRSMLRNGDCFPVDYDTTKVEFLASTLNFCFTDAFAAGNQVRNDAEWFEKFDELRRHILPYLNLDREKLFPRDSRLVRETDYRRKYYTPILRFRNLQSCEIDITSSVKLGSRGFNNADWPAHLLKKWVRSCTGFKFEPTVMLSSLLQRYIRWDILAAHATGDLRSLRGKVLITSQQEGVRRIIAAFELEKRRRNKEGKIAKLQPVSCVVFGTKAFNARHLEGAYVSENNRKLVIEDSYAGVVLFALPDFGDVTTLHHFLRMMYAYEPLSQDASWSFRNWW